MKILITNDDSISSSVLLPLAEWASKLGEVTIVVPKQEQSGKSHGIEIHKSFEVLKTNLSPTIEAYTVDSTPADCVRFALAGLGQDYDLVISGINRGLNIGQDIIYSGTVSAVMESAYHGICSVAISTEPETFDYALENLDTIYDFFIQHKLFEKNNIYNVNIPLNPKNIRITRQGGPYFGDEFLPQENNLYLPVGKSIFTERGETEFDTETVLIHRHISITPLTTNRTNMEVFHSLSYLNKEERGC